MRQVSIESILVRVPIDAAVPAANRVKRPRVALLPALAAILVFLCATPPTAHATNFTCDWNDATANWTTVADWSTCNSTAPNNSQPTATDTYDVTISTGNPTLTTTITIGTVTITSPGAWTVTGAGANASLTGSLSNSGTVGLGGTAAVTVTGDYTNAGVLGVDVGSGDGGGNLTIGGTLANSKTVQVGSGFENAGAANTLSVGALTNSSGASFEVFGSAGHPATLAFTGTGFSQNDGTFGVTNITPLTLNNSFTNSATGSFGLGAVATVTVTGDYTNAGVLGVDVGSGDGGGNLTIGGTLSNTKTVQVGSGFENAGAANTLSVGALTNSSGASFEVFGSAGHPATLAFTGTGFSQNDGTFGVTNITPLTLNNSFTNSATGSFGLGAVATVTVTGDYTNAGVLGVDVGSGDGGGNLTIGGTLSNTKTVQVGSGFENAGAANTLSVGALTNSSGASFEVFGSAGHPATLAFTGTGFSQNDGTFGVTNITPLTLNNSFTNSATGSFGLGAVATVTVTGDYTNAGVLGVDVGSGDGGGNLTIGGTLSNTKTVQVGSGFENAGAANTLSVGALTNSSGASFEVFGSAGHPATLAFTGTGFSQNDGTFGVTNITPLTLNNSFTNSAAGSFGLGAVATVTVTGDYTNAGVLGVDVGSGDGGGNLTIGGTLSNTKTVQVGSGFENAGAANTLSVGALTNSSGASFEVFGSAGHPATLAFTGTGFSQNDGTFGVTNITPLTLNNSFTNSAAGSFGLGAVATVTVTGDYTNAGVLGVDVGSGDGGGNLTIGGTLANSKNVQVGSGFENAGAANSLSLGGLSNAATGSIGVFGSAANHATVSIAAASGTTASNAGSLNMQENVAFSASAGVNFDNSGTFFLDTGNGTGGSTMTVGGTLSNSGTASIGNTLLSAPTTVTAAGLSNSSAGVINLLGNTGNPANQASVTVNGQASNAGTINIPTASNVTVTGAGNAYTQTAGFTNLSGGALAAPSVNITGGTLRGTGTVTGAANISGTGTIQAINLANSNLAAVLTIDGNYTQSGGTFSELLHGTGIQIDKLDVTAGHAVTLTGGNLQVSGVAFALGQTFDDIVTFQPGQLSGTFATLQGGGNGMKVDLGGGLTLQAIYDNAGGDISLAVIRSGKIWNDANGNWTTDPSKWTAPGAPQPTDDVIIGSTNNGNVTLNNNSTVNSLTINPSNALTNTSGTTLTVSATVANNGSLTLGGTLNALGAVANNAGASLIMQGGTLTAASLTNTGTTSGFGTITPAIANAGLVQANGGTLTAQNGIQGTGNIIVNPSATLDLSHAATGSSASILNVNGSLNLGSQNLTVANDYNNANFGTGNSFDKHANVTRTTGQILAAGPNPANMEVITGAKITGGNTPSSTLNLGIVHVGDSTTYQIANQGVAGNPSLRGAIQTNVNGGNITGGLLSGTGVTAGNFGPVPPGSPSDTFTVTAASTGVLSGQAVHIADNFDNVLERTLSIIGQINNLAVSAYGKSSGNGVFSGGGTAFTLDFGTLQQDSGPVSALLFALNSASAPADELAGSFAVVGGEGDFDLPWLADMFGGLEPGQEFGPLSVDFDPTTPGIFDERIDLLGFGSNASGYNKKVDDVFLTIHVDVTSSTPAPEPGSMTMLASGLGMIFFIVRRRRRR